jgi:hypothetical protein
MSINSWRKVSHVEPILCHMHIKNLPPVDEQKDNTYLQDRLDQMQILFPTKARLLGMHWDDQSD